MSMPCEQEDSIANISKTLERMEKSQERLVELLEKVANQEARISHAEDHIDTNHKDMDEIFTRLRNVEIQQAAYEPEARLRMNDVIEEFTQKMVLLNARVEKILNAYKKFTGRTAKLVYALILVLIVAGFYIDLKAHFEIAVPVLEFIARRLF